FGRRRAKSESQAPPKPIRETSCKNRLKSRNLLLKLFSALYFYPKFWIRHHKARGATVPQHDRKPPLPQGTQENDCRKI
ncbi:MAG: hypothetical protein IIY15_06245, partial [Flavobacteriales bacterium]|nr:hypothetical protein [Flavobacteriales bacterium]